MQIASKLAVVELKTSSSSLLILFLQPVNCCTTARLLRTPRQHYERHDTVGGRCIRESAAWGKHRTNKVTGRVTHSKLALSTSQRPAGICRYRWGIGIRKRRSEDGTKTVRTGRRCRQRTGRKLKVKPVTYHRELTMLVLCSQCRSTAHAVTRRPSYCVM